MLALPWSSRKEKHQSSLHRYCGLQIRQIEIRLTTACGALKQENLKHRIRIRTKWAKLHHIITAAPVRQWLRRLSACVREGGVLISSTAFNSDIVFLQ